MPQQITCQNCKQEFVIESEDFAFYEKIKVPPPTWCPLCRANRRMAFRNEWTLYKRKSDFPKSGGKDIFSMYAPNSGYRVYEKEVWLTDEWDPLVYGRGYDFSRPFFEQFNELLHEVPLKNLNVVNGVRSDYSNNFSYPKNCYLCFNGSESEDCLYSHGITFCRNCVDASHLSKCENCYDSFWLTSGAANFGCNNCENSLNVWFSKNCAGCSDCVGCVNLRNKQYHIFNQPYSKKDYQVKFKEFNLSSRKGYEALQLKAREFWTKFPNKFLEGFQNTNVSGSYIDHSKNVKNSFLVRDGENLKFCQYLQELPGCKDSYDWSIWGDNGQLMYECHASGLGTHNVRFSLFIQEDASDIEYSMVCSSSSNLFGCVGVRKKQYCILNKQYSKEEYEALVPKIREQMKTMPYHDKVGRIYSYGEFFPPELSPFSYNESMAQEYFPLNREKALAGGYHWRDITDRNYIPTKKQEDISDDIKNVPDSITDEIVACDHAGKECNQPCLSAFRVTKDELAFHRKFNLPLPRLCHNCRTFERLKQRNGLKLYSRKCQCAGPKSENGVYQNTAAHAHGDGSCPNEFETSYATDRLEIVYCEACYNAEVA